MEDGQKLVKGSRVFWLDSRGGWSQGVLVSLDAKRATVKDEESGDTGTCSVENLHPRLPDSYDPDKSDLFDLKYVYPWTVMFCIKERYEKKHRMYTRMGGIVISLNPFRPMEYNSAGAMAGFAKSKQTEPHVWEVAMKTFTKIVARDRGNQSILISGESGAGKTETTKTLIDFLGHMSSHHSCNEIQRGVAESVNRKLKASNPILESFGNAKTCRNDNSSRFGKYIKLFFDKRSGVLTGAEMIHYLLEKSRIVTQNEGERGYHVFYEMLAGMDRETKARLGGLTVPQDYACLRKGGTYTRKSASGGPCDDAREYAELRDAMSATGISADQQMVIFEVLAAVLHFQNVRFGENPSTRKAMVEDEAPLAAGAKLLGVGADELKERFLTKSKDRHMTLQATREEAADMRDALSKALYSSVFDWLVCRINEAIKPESSGDVETQRYIGLLDIFGFENFARNSFEQLCINFTNETLQNHYNKYTFQEDMEECKQEEIECPVVHYPDNAECLSMIRDDGGIIDLLNQETQAKIGTDEHFTQATREKFAGHKNYRKKTQTNDFEIVHYAATVEYDTCGWREKNSDTLKDDMRQLIQSSTEPSGFVRQLLDTGAMQGPVKKARTVAQKFSRRLDELKVELASTDSSFIRTVKPNTTATPLKVDSAYVMAQLTCAGVKETIDMKREGYPVRHPMRDFWARYRLGTKVSEERPPPDAQLRDACHRIAAHWVGKRRIPPPNVAVGKTKVFMKAHVVDSLETDRQREVRRRMCVVKRRLRRWVAWYRTEGKRKLEEERRRQAVQAAAGHLREHPGLTGEQEVWFQELVAEFPSVDLPVVHDVVGQVQSKETAWDFLHDQVRGVPRAVLRVFDVARLDAQARVRLMQGGLCSHEKLQALTLHDMRQLGVTEDEARRLRDALLGERAGENQRWIDGEAFSDILPVAQLVPAPPPEQEEPRRPSHARAPAPAASAPAPAVHAPTPTAPPSVWSCALCTLENPVSANVCGVCQAPGPGSAPAPPRRPSGRSQPAAPAQSVPQAPPAQPVPQAQPAPPAQPVPQARPAQPPAQPVQQRSSIAMDESVSNLVGMGFTAEAARDALVRAGGDAERAVALLLGE
eukprot:TRINITY_DN11933_c0_g1_i4.p1 TRINITY_DN11933_c0_g1~~TRINITY_DN11933_c0_g1_i4.p1  ORF type:complete len:1104 (+),score=324.20 TRINITY_DN11933_c0_g1_i4:46-3357(+)